MGIIEMAYKYRKIKLPNGTTRDEHRIIMENYLGRKLEYNEIVHHCNEKHRDNRLDNLELMLRKEHVFYHKQDENLHFGGYNSRFVKGDNNLKSKLKESQVVKIREMAILGIAQRELGKMFGVHFSTISDVVRGRTWRHIP